MSDITDLRNTLRTQIFSEGKKRVVRKKLPLFGSEVEIKNPSLAKVLAYQKELADNPDLALIKLLIDFCYIPDTDEKVFEAGDQDTLMAMPFDSEVMEFVNQVNKLLGVDLEAAEGNLEGTQNS